LPAIWFCRRPPNPEIPPSTGFVLELKGIGISFSLSPDRALTFTCLAINPILKHGPNEIRHRPTIRLRSSLNRRVERKLNP
jgi:hypothetical protein